MGKTAAIHDTSGMKRTVLIVDDHEGFRATARRVLAADGNSGVTAAAESRPDLALVDVMLPDFDGFEVVKRIQESGEAPEIVLISSHERADLGSLVENSGARGFVSKSELSAAALEAL